MILLPHTGVIEPTYTHVYVCVCVCSVMEHGSRSVSLQMSQYRRHTNRARSGR